ncbi:MAG TPA: type VI secretion system baseplate subunit TssK [Anaeromyxobacter sp.]|nr:type VI secretion system baseplate subunit TssK [Anaeromyxobacter sp.]
MRSPLRVIWSEGMFLSPQHLQAQDRYYETLLASRLEAVAPFAWGVSELEIDAAALAAGQLRVERFAGVLAGGLCVTFSGNDVEAPPPRSVAEAFPAGARSLEVWLGVAREREGIAAAGPPGPPEAPRPRFHLGSRPVADVMQPGAVVPVDLGRPNAVLLLGAESREDHEAIQIAEIVRTGSGQLALAETFLPPMLRIGATPRLPGQLRELVARMVARQRELADGRRQREAAAGEVSGSDVSRTLQLALLSGAIPGLAHLADLPDAPPRELYLALASLAGQLAAFAPDADVTGIPRYAHEEPRSTFDPLFARLHAYLSGLGVERFTRVPLEIRGLQHVARAVDDAILREAHLILAVRSELAETVVAEQLPRLCKIAAQGDLTALVQAAAPGAPLQVLHRPPAEIPLKAGTVYFQIDRNHRLWNGVLTERTVAIHLPPPFDPSRTKLELLAIPKAAG